MGMHNVMLTPICLYVFYFLCLAFYMNGTCEILSSPKHVYCLHQYVYGRLKQGGSEQY